MKLPEDSYDQADDHPLALNQLQLQKKIKK
jgi:hypothetical protein